MEFLHCNYIVHRDLKLENVLISAVNSSRAVKLADFGLAAYCRNGDSIIMFSSFQGSRKYMAPEIHACLGSDAQAYDARKSDIFALGVFLFCLVLGRFPF